MAARALLRQRDDRLDVVATEEDCDVADAPDEFGARPVQHLADGRVTRVAIADAESYLDQFMVFQVLIQFRGHAGRNTCVPDVDHGFQVVSQPAEVFLLFVAEFHGGIIGKCGTASG